MVFAVLAPLVLAAACGGDGTELREPSADQTTTTEAAADGSTVPEAEADPSGSEVGPGGFTLQVDGLTPGGPIPVALSCEGENQPPELSWQNVPSSAAELAVTVVDPDADDFVHWVVTGIDPGLAGFDGADLPPGTATLLNGAGEVGWFGPCPPPGMEHDYRFTLFALPQPSGIDPESDPTEAIAALEASAAATTAVTGTFASS